MKDKLKLKSVLEKLSNTLDNAITHRSGYFSAMQIIKEQLEKVNADLKKYSDNLKEKKEIEVIK